MVERRWLLRLVPPGVAVSAVALGLARTIGAADGAWEPPPCPGGTAALVERFREPAAPGDLRPRGWFTLDPVTDARGELAGQRLRMGLGPSRQRYVPLPPESAASGPFGAVVLVTADDGRRSDLTAYDSDAGCRWDLGGSADVVRRATLDVSAVAVLEFRVDRRTRADLGVWRRSLVEETAPRRVVAPLAADASVGPTFSTSLTWSQRGDRLAVQSCGALFCRTRLLDPATGVSTEPATIHGELVGLAEGSMVAYAPCVGLPCPLLAVDLATGSASVITEDAGLATLASTPDGARLLVERGGSVELRRVDGAFVSEVTSPATGNHLVPSVERAAAGLTAPPGWLVATPDGRSPEGAVLTRLSDGTTVPLAEVTR